MFFPAGFFPKLLMSSLVERKGYDKADFRRRLDEDRQLDLAGALAEDEGR